MPLHYICSRVVQCAVAMNLEFRRAKIFRRTGHSSFAVQLASSSQDGEDEIPSFMPGIIHVHCRDVDWGYLGRDPDLLEKRLCMMGTPPSLFSNKDDAHHQEGAAVMLLNKGVSVALGSYDSRLKGFVGCRLKVEEREPCITKGEHTASESVAIGKGEIAITNGEVLKKRRQDDSSSAWEPSAAGFTEGRGVQRSSSLSISSSSGSSSSHSSPSNSKRTRKRTPFRWGIIGGRSGP